jgi:hypothetical protein
MATLPIFTADVSISSITTKKINFKTFTTNPGGDDTLWITTAGVLMLGNMIIGPVAPISLTQGTNIKVDGTAPNFTIATTPSLQLTDLSDTTSTALLSFDSAVNALRPLFDNNALALYSDLSTTGTGILGYQFITVVGNTDLIIPTGAKMMHIFMGGGGGGGGAASFDVIVTTSFYYAGGGGASGTYYHTKLPINLRSGISYQAQIGAGGVGGVNSGNGADGGATSLNILKDNTTTTSLITCAGGGAGNNHGMGGSGYMAGGGGATDNNGAAAGTSNITTPTGVTILSATNGSVVNSYQGGDGALNPYSGGIGSSAVGYGGGAGGGPTGGVGGDGTTVNNAGGNGTLGGGGGGGLVNNFGFNGNFYNGGNGGDGFFFVIYT